MVFRGSRKEGYAKNVGQVSKLHHNSNAELKHPRYFPWAEEPEKADIAKAPQQEVVEEMLKQAEEKEISLSDFDTNHSNLV